MAFPVISLECSGARRLREFNRMYFASRLPKSNEITAIEKARPHSRHRFPCTRSVA